MSNVETKKLQLETEDEEMNEESENEEVEEEEEAVTKKKKKKPGIVYLSSIPPKMNVRLLTEALMVHGEIGRVFLQPSTSNFDFYNIYALTFHSVVNN